ncbi:hypothetical protein AMQ83_02785, partial [Paenibacillus riograndensis]
IIVYVKNKISGGISLKKSKMVAGTLLSTLLFTSFSGTLVSAAESEVGGSEQEALKIIVEKHNDILDIIKNDSDFVITQDNGNGNFSFAPKSTENIDAKSVDAKVNEILEAVETAQPQELVQPQAIDIPRTLSGVNILSTPSGSWYSTKFNTTATETGFTEPLVDDRTTFSGNSTNEWASSAGNADSIDASDVFSIGYVGTAVFFSWPPGLTVSSGGSSATLSYPQLTNNKTYYHYYSGIEAKAYNIISAAQTSNATIKYGNKTFSVQAFDSESYI